jgi:hypothetical protein
VASFTEIAHKKVAGVPVIYIGGAFAVIFAIVAYRLKGNSTAVTTDTSQADAANPSGADTSNNDVADSVDGTDYSGLNTTGTVTVAPATTTPASGDVTQTNQTWLASGVAYLMTSAGGSHAGGEAQTALTHYLDGDDLSYQEGAMRDAVIAKIGLPPEALPGVGQTSSQPAQRQFSNTPGKHTVKGDNDNTFGKLATLYYGSNSADNVKKLYEYNLSVGSINSTFSPGTVITVPTDWTPQYYTVTGVKDTSASQIAAKNGLTTGQLGALNVGFVYPAKKGNRLRVL